MANNNEIKITLSADDKASASINKVKSSISDFASKNTETFSKMAVAGTAATWAILAVAWTSVNAYAEVERANRQLEHAVVGVSKWTKEQVEQIKNITQALQDKAWVDADSLNMGVAQLSTFGLSTNAVKNLTKSLADLTVNQNWVNASWDDYISSANIMAKAMRWEFGMLEKMWIRFTEHQQELIKTWTETEKVSALQDWLAQNLRETTDTVSWADLALAKARRSMEDMQENIGKALAPVLLQLSDIITPIIKNIWERIDKNPALVQQIVEVWLAITWAVAVLWTLWLILPSIIAWISFITWPIWLVVIAIWLLATAWATNFWWIQESTKALWDTIWPIFTSIKTTLVDTFSEIRTNIQTMWTNITWTTETDWTSFQTKMYEIFIAVAEVVKLAVEIITNVLWTAVAILTDVITFVVNVFQWDWSGAWNSIQKTFSDIWIWMSGLLDTLFPWILDKINWFIDSIIDFFYTLWDWIKNAVTWSFDWLFGKIESAIQKAKDMASKVQWWISWSSSSSSSTNTAWWWAIWWPVTAGVPYTVWEMGREIFIPSTSGRIVPNWAVWWASITINMWSVSIKDNNDLEYFMQEMESRLQRAVSNANLYAI